MKKIIIMFLLLTINLLLVSCTMGGGRMIIYDDNDRKADIRMEQILESIKNKDKAALKEMFSKQALEEADDFDGNMEYLFEFFQGSIKSWERDCFIGSESYDYGKKLITNTVWYIVTTDEENYMFFLIDNIKNTINPDNAGLYTLRAIKARDEETQFTFCEKMEIPGIYNPGR